MDSPSSKIRSPLSLRLRKLVPEENTPVRSSTPPKSYNMVTNNLANIDGKSGSWATRLLRDWARMEAAEKKRDIASRPPVPKVLTESELETLEASRPMREWTRHVSEDLMIPLLNANWTHTSDPIFWEELVRLFPSIETGEHPGFLEISNEDRFMSLRGGTVYDFYIAALCLKEYGLQHLISNRGHIEPNGDIVIYDPSQPADAADKPCPDLIPSSELLFEDASFGFDYDQPSPVSTLNPDASVFVPAAFQHSSHEPTTTIEQSGPSSAQQDFTEVANQRSNQQQRVEAGHQAGQGRSSGGGC